MPCDSVVMIVVDLKDPLKAAKAIKRAGLHNVRYENGQLVGRSLTDADAAAVKRTYAEEAIEEASKRFGWMLKETKANVGVKALLVQKGGWR